MLKIIENIESVTNPKKTKNKVDGDSVVGSSKVINQTSFTKRKNQAKMAKSKNLIKLKNRDFLFNSRNIDVKGLKHVYKITC